MVSTNILATGVVGTGALISNKEYLEPEEVPEHNTHKFPFPSKVMSPELSVLKSVTTVPEELRKVLVIVVHEFSAIL
jgi:hypothetical protein